MGKAKKQSDGIRIKGMFRVHIEDNNKIVGDSGWKNNQVTNLGFNQYLVSTLGAIAGSKQITHMALGTGTAPASSATTLAGEITTCTRARGSVTAATQSNSMTLRCTATFTSSDLSVGTGATLQNIGLFNSSAVTTGTIFAGNTYATSAVASNQNVNATYDIIFV